MRKHRGRKEFVGSNGFDLGRAVLEGKAMKTCVHSWAMGLPVSRFYAQKCRN
jgi:hypothetical protein